MMTLLSVSEAPRKRRRYIAEFKARVVAACQQPDASVAGVALEHGLNTNLVHKWIRTTQQPQPSTSPSFIPIALPTPVIFNPVVQITAFKQRIYSAQFPVAFQD